MPQTKPKGQREKKGKRDRPCFVCGKLFNTKGYGLHIAGTHPVDYANGINTYGTKKRVCDWPEAIAVYEQAKAKHKAERKRIDKVEVPEEMFPKLESEKVLPEMGLPPDFPREIDAEIVEFPKRHTSASQYAPQARLRPKFVMINPNLVVNVSTILSVSLNRDESQGWVIVDRSGDIVPYRITPTIYDLITCELLSY